MSVDFLYYGDVYLSLWFEDIAAEHIAFLVSCYVTEYLQVLWVMRDVKYSEKGKKMTNELQQLTLKLSHCHGNNKANVLFTDLVPLNMS